MFYFHARKHDRRRHAKRIEPGLDRLEDRLCLATFKVNTILDTVAVSLTSGKDSTGHISLRSAIQAANARGGKNTIILPAGTFTLSIPGIDEDKAATGDLDLSGNVTIKGKSAGATIIDAHKLDRVFHVLSGKVTIMNLTIENGLADAAGGLLNTGGQVTLSSVTVADNVARGEDGDAGLSAVRAGSSDGAGADGLAGAVALAGGIGNGSGSLLLSHCTIVGNLAQGGNGGEGGAGAQVQGDPATNDGKAVAGQGGKGGDGGPALGGGVFNGTGASLTIDGSTFANNDAFAGTAGEGGTGGDGHGSAGGAGRSGGSGTGGGGGAGGTGNAAVGGGLANEGIVVFSGHPSTFMSNQVAGGGGGAGGIAGNGIGGKGGAYAGGSGAGSGGYGQGGNGGLGGIGGDAFGGGLANGSSITSTVALTFFGNLATGGRGGGGGPEGAGLGGAGGDGSVQGGGAGIGGRSGSASPGGGGSGGGVLNGDGTLLFQAPRKSKQAPVVSFVRNQASGGSGGPGGETFKGQGGIGGNGVPVAAGGGQGGAGSGSGPGGDGSAGGDARGGGLLNTGNVSFVGFSVNITDNTVTGGAGGPGATGSFAIGGAGGDGTPAGVGGNAGATDGGVGGNGGSGAGGGVLNDATGKLVFQPRKGARKGSKQAKASNLVERNDAIGGRAGAGGLGGTPTAGAGGKPNGKAGFVSLVRPGRNGNAGLGVGGGFDLIAGSTTTKENTMFSGNHASTTDNDVHGG